jgi:hypothetical protein
MLCVLEKELHLLYPSAMVEGRKCRKRRMKRVAAVFGFRRYYLYRCLVAVLFWVWKNQECNYCSRHVFKFRMPPCVDALCRLVACRRCDPNKYRRRTYRIHTVRNAVVTGSSSDFCVTPLRDRQVQICMTRQVQNANGNAKNKIKPAVRSL